MRKMAKLFERKDGGVDMDEELIEEEWAETMEENIKDMGGEKFGSYWNEK